MITLNYPFPEKEWARNFNLAARICRQGGILIYPTETFYAIGGHALNTELGRRLSLIKHRPAEKTFPTLCGNLAATRSLVRQWPEPALRLARKYWPGPLTMILPGHIGLSDSICDQSGGIAVRWSSHPLLNELAKFFSGPLISTSANFSGNPPTATAAKLDPELLAQVDLLLIADNPEPQPQPSTIIDARVDPPLLVRRGSLEISETDSSIII
ncbi:MAG: threonylcarbamoyl-AMP synthase [Deltaproteobacteria bacterium]|nr:threonylcarbamoyl-AMP synthase [Deltaproteobacteria bacterium]